MRIPPQLIETSKFFWPLAVFLVVLGVSLPGQPPSAAIDNSPIFYASFERNALADEAGGDEIPLGNQNLKIVREGKRGSALLLDSTSVLSYDAPGNLYAERGTISFWWKLDEPIGRAPFSIVRVSYVHSSTLDDAFAELQWTGESLRFWLRDRFLIVHAAEASGKTQPVAGRWFHLAVTWDELDGLHLYLDGQLVGQQLGRWHHAASLDQLGFHTEVLTPGAIKGNGRRTFIDELRIYGQALPEKSVQDLAQLGAGKTGAMPPVALVSPVLWKEHWRDRFGWEDPSRLPLIQPSTTIRELPILEGKDSRKDIRQTFDGRPGTGWPGEMPGYPDSWKVLNLKISNEPFNYLALLGSFSGQIMQLNSRQGILDILKPTGNGAHLSLVHALTTAGLQLLRQSGEVKELNLFSIQGRTLDLPSKSSSAPASSNRMAYRLLPSVSAAGLPGVSRSQVSSLYNFNSFLLRQYLPEDRRSWIGVPSEIYQASQNPGKSGVGLHYCHVILPPFLRHTPLDAIRMRLSEGTASSDEEAIVHIAVKDPLLPPRDLLSIDFRIPPRGQTDLLLNFPDLVVPAGRPIWMEFASDREDFADSRLTGAEVELWLAETGESARANQSRREYLDSRLNLIRDVFRELSQDRSWMDLDLEIVRRQFRYYDEAMALVDDVLRVDPGEPTALACRGWLNRNTPPPEFRQPQPPSNDIPLWAYQQQSLVEQYVQVLEWWIKNRQEAGGEFGDGIFHDSSLVENWPGIALMEGRSEEILQSLNSFLEACYRNGALAKGLNAISSDPLTAYHQGLGILALANLLDYGNPRLVELLMESCRHYDRITGENPAGHRHFLSALFSATEIMEEAPLGREDPHSSLMWHPGLMLAWYNGNPQVMSWLTGYADSLLAHWQKDRYPLLSRRIRFTSDAVVGRGLPDPESIGLCWGVYRLTGDEKYLWILDKLAQNDSLERAEKVPGRWLDSVDPEPYRTVILQLAKERTIWDKNLQGNESGVLARQFAYELTKDKELVKDYQGALLKHMAQNQLLYTDVQPVSSFVRLPQQALQRARLGGVASAENVIFPGHAVSWEGGRGNVAALVTHSTPKSLRITTYNLGKSFQDVNLRFWELENGTYEVLEGADVGDDSSTEGHDQIDVITTRRTLNLKRFTSIPVTLRPRKVTVIEIKQIHKGTPLWELPDLAISASDLQYSPGNSTARLTVHNIGSKPSPQFTLQVEDERRTVVFRKEVDGLEAPLDCKPRTTIVEISGLPARLNSALFFRLNPEKKFEEISEQNNQIRTGPNTPRNKN
jgi:hypothetical protein